MPTPMSDSWMERLVSVLRERWDGASGDPAWTFTYGELGHLAEAFPGTAHSIEAGPFDASGEIRIRIKLVSEEHLAESLATDQERCPYALIERIA